MNVKNQSRRTKLKKDFTVETEDYPAAVLQRLSQDKKYRETSIKVGTKLFPIHKCLFGTFSDFFDKLFSSEMKEKYQDEIEVKGVSSDIFELIVNYVYTGSIPFTDDNIFEVMAASDYLAIDELRMHCVQHLVENVSRKNCLACFTCARQYDIKDLQSRCETIISNNLDLLREKGCLAEMNFDTFCQLIERRNKTCKSEEQLFATMISWVQQDFEERSHLFLVLFEKLYLELIPRNYLKTVVLQEKLVRDSLDSLNAVVDLLTSTSEDAPKTARTTDNTGSEEARNHPELLEVHEEDLRHYPAFSRKTCSVPPQHMMHKLHMLSKKLTPSRNTYSSTYDALIPSDEGEDFADHKPETITSFRRTYANPVAEEEHCDFQSPWHMEESDQDGAPLNSQEWNPNDFREAQHHFHRHPPRYGRPCGRGRHRHGRHHRGPQHFF